MSALLEQVAEAKSRKEAGKTKTIVVKVRGATLGRAGRLSVQYHELTLDNKGLCATCGDAAVHDKKYRLWWHVPFVKGEKHYDHQVKVRR